MQDEMDRMARQAMESKISELGREINMLVEAVKEIAQVVQPSLDEDTKLKLSQLASRLSHIRHF